MARKSQGTKAITITIPHDLLVDIDKDRGDVTRSLYLTRLIRLGYTEKKRFDDTVERARYGIEYDPETRKQWRVYYGEKGIKRTEIKK